MNAKEALEKAKNYKALTGTPIDDDIVEAFAATLQRLENIEKRGKEKREQHQRAQDEIKEWGDKQKDAEGIAMSRAHFFQELSYIKDIDYILGNSDDNKNT